MPALEQEFERAAWLRRRAVRLLCLTLIVAVSAACLWTVMQPAAPIHSLVWQARRALVSGDYATAGQLCEQALQQDASHVPALLLAGDAAMRTERFDDALKFFRRIPDSDSDNSIAAQFATAEAQRAQGRLTDAETEYRKVIQHRPAHLMAHERLAFILDLQGRRWESVPHLLEQLRQDRISYSILIRLGTRDSLIPFPEELERIRQAGHDRAAVKLAEAVGFLAEQHPEQAEPLLREAIRLRPEFIEPQARLGRLLADQKLSEIPAWHSQLPPVAESHPDIQTALGLWCANAGQIKAALGCFEKAVTIDPDQRTALYQIGQLAKSSEFSALPEVAEAGLRCADRARLLQQLAATINQLSLNRSEIKAMLTASELLEKLGRYWEAYGWCGLALNTDPRQTETRQRMQTLARRLSPSLPQTDPAVRPLRDLSMADFPEPEWPAMMSKSVLDHPPVSFSSGIQFVDRADEAGLHFTYFHGREQVEPGTKMYEFAGGGAGVLDFDLDGAPDVYLTQGCRWPAETESKDIQDRLFQCGADGRFRDVTAQAGLGDGWFSQGIAVGDLNSDGWPDLYIANIGRNRLYCNNGDGTFRDVTDEAGISGTQWTTSCLIADLNGDTCPDLYDVNYLSGDDLFERLCLVEGVPRACVPGVFPAERDRIHMNQQNGVFDELAGQQAEVLEPPRPGLGVVATDIDGSGRLSLFVANDVMVNAFLVNETDAAGGPLRMREDALRSGLAFDRDGRAQACMGVAADDVDGNGLLDIFVTNYYEEANSMYLQMTPGSFVESSRTAGLYNASLRQLGFGTQFLDADLDGSVDLMVANGHLDDFSYLDIPYRMPPQLFRNQGHGQLQDISDAAGDYFTRDLLGRSVAALDWNTDGRPDLVVTHIETPVALLTNESTDCGQWLKLRLWGTTSSRDAVGGTVTVRSGEDSWTRQLTAGSGYQASNERVLMFGLGMHTHVDELTVEWPSGRQQTFGDLPTNRQLAIVEGRPRPFTQPTSR